MTRIIARLALALGFAVAIAAGAHSGAQLAVMHVDNVPAHVVAVMHVDSAHVAPEVMHVD